MRIADKCSRCGGWLVEHETGPNPSFKCLSCGVIQKARQEASKMKACIKKYMQPLLLAAAIAGPGNAHAIIPTIDVANLIQSILTVLESIEDTANQITQIENQISQITQAAEAFEQQIKDYENMSGSYGLADLLNSLKDKEARRYMPKRWQDTLDLIDTGETDAAKAAREAMEAGQEYKAEDIHADNITLAEKYRRGAKNLYTQIGLQQESYNRAAQQLDNIETLIDTIDTSTDQKQTLDLQARIAAEQALIDAEKARSQAVANMNALQIREDQMNRRAADVSMANGDIPEIPKP